MSTDGNASLSVWIARHAILVWIGILINFAFIIPLVFDPAWILGALGIPLNQLIWARAAGWLLFIITCYYVPATIDFQRYRANAWLAIVPSRSGGTIFFVVAVFVFGHPPGFLSIALVDGVIGLSTLYCLIKIETLERARRAAGVRT
jgi:hypothetical protein